MLLGFQGKGLGSVGWLLWEGGGSLPRVWQSWCQPRLSPSVMEVVPLDGGKWGRNTCTSTYRGSNPRRAVRARERCSSADRKVSAGGEEVFQCQSSPWCSPRWGSSTPAAHRCPESSRDPPVQDSLLEQVDAGRRLWSSGKPVVKQAPGRTCGPVKGAHTEAGLLSGLLPCRGPTLEQFMENCSPWEGLILEKFMEDYGPWEKLMSLFVLLLTLWVFNCISSPLPMDRRNRGAWVGTWHPARLIPLHIGKYRGCIKHIMRSWNLFFHMEFSSKLNDMESSLQLCLTFSFIEIWILFFQLIPCLKFWRASTKNC